MLNRLNKLGASQSEIVDVYNKQIRCVLELAERVQKCALHVILGDSYISYDQTVITLEAEQLSDRRSKLCLNFAKRLDKK